MSNNSFSFNMKSLKALHAAYEKSKEQIELERQKQAEQHILTVIKSMEKTCFEALQQDYIERGDFLQFNLSCLEFVRLEKDVCSRALKTKFAPMKVSVECSECQQDDGRMMNDRDLLFRVRIQPDYFGKN